MNACALEKKGSCWRVRVLKFNKCKMIALNLLRFK